jgi:hypothetical protein
MAGLEAELRARAAAAAEEEEDGAVAAAEAEAGEEARAHAALAPRERSALLWATATLCTADLHGGKGEARLWRPTRAAPRALPPQPPAVPMWRRRRGRAAAESQPAYASLLRLLLPWEAEAQPRLLPQRLAVSSFSQRAQAAMVETALAGYSGWDLAVLCWAMGRARAQPPPDWRAPLLAAVAARAALPAATDGFEAAALPGGAAQGLSSRALAMACWGLSSVGLWPPPEWQAALAEAAASRVGRGELAGRDLALVLTALARWTRLPESLRRRGGSLRLRGARRAHGGGEERAAHVRLRAAASALAGLALERCGGALGLARQADGSVPTTLLRPRARGAVAAGGEPPGNSLAPGPAVERHGTELLPSPSELRWAARVELRTLCMTMRAVSGLPLETAVRQRWAAAWRPHALALLATQQPTRRALLLSALSRLGLQADLAWRERAEQVCMEGLGRASSHRRLATALARIARSSDAGSKGGAAQDGGERA